MKKRLIWLDDLRDPFQEDWLATYNPLPQVDSYSVEWVKDYDEFIKYISTNGLPDGICFDHDLGSVEKTGYDCAKWLVDYCLDNNLDIPPYSIQSANPVGKGNIDGILKSYKKYYVFKTKK